MKTKVFNLILIIATIVALLPLVAFGGVANADGPNADTAVLRLPMISQLTLKTDFGQPQDGNYVTTINLKPTVPISVTGILSWSTFEIKPGLEEGRAWAFNNAPISPQGAVFTDTIGNDYLQLVDLTIKKPFWFDIGIGWSQKLWGLPGPKAELNVTNVNNINFVSLQVWNTTTKTLYTEAGESVLPGRPKWVNIQRDRKFSLYLTKTGGRNKEAQALRISFQNVYHIPEQ